MSEYKTEEEQAEALKKWWNENGKFIIAGVAIGIGAIFGWRGYNGHLEQQALAASELYQQMLVAERDNDSEKVTAYANSLLDNYQSNTYATFAALMLAKQTAEANQLEKAEAHLRWVVANNSQDGFEHIAQLRLARVLIAAGKLNAAEQTLDVTAMGHFTARYEELRGDIFVKQNEMKAARQAYQKALSSSDGNSNPVLQMKLDNLGRS